MSIASPTIRVLPAQPEDATALAKAEGVAFSNDPVTLALFGPYNPEDFAFRAKEHAEGIAKKDPTTHYIKAVLDDGTIVGLGIWHFYLDEESGNGAGRMDLDKKEWAPGANADACRDLFGQIYKMRDRMRGQRHASQKVLSCLATDIAHQGLGVGSAMLQYGIDIADKENLPGWLESSLQAHNLYKKFGFEDVDSFTIELSKYGGDGDRPIFGMARPSRQN